LSKTVNSSSKTGTTIIYNEFAAGDFMIAFNADDSIVRLENFDLVCGPIEDITVRGVWAENCYTAFRFLSVTSPIRRIHMENIYTGCRYYFINMDGARYCNTPLFREEQFHKGSGRIENITIDNMCFWNSEPNLPDKGLITCETIPKNFMMRCLMRDMNHDKNPARPTLSVGKVTETMVYADMGEACCQKVLQHNEDTFCTEEMKLTAADGTEISIDNFDKSDKIGVIIDGLIAETDPATPERVTMITLFNS